MTDNLPLSKRILRFFLTLLTRVWLWRIAVPAISKVRKILVVRSDHLGDLILSLPAIAQIRMMYPTGIIHALVAPASEDLLRASHLTNHIYIVKAKQPLSWILQFARQLKKERYDLMVDFGSGNPAPVALAALLARISMRIGFDVGVRTALFSNTVAVSSDRFEGDSALAVLEPLGYKQKDPVPSTLWKKILPPERWKDPSSVGINDPFIVFCPFVDPMGLLKEWPIDRYIAIINKLSEDEYFADYSFVITGSRDDEKRATIIEQSCPKRIISRVGKTRVLDWLNLMGNARMVLTNNSGAMQMSYFIDTPVIVINGPSNLKRWMTSSVPGNIHLIYRELDCTGNDCSFCRKTRRDCLESISVEDVFEKIKMVFKTSTRSAY